MSYKILKRIYFQALMHESVDEKSETQLISLGFFNASCSHTTWTTTTTTAYRKMQGLRTQVGKRGDAQGQYFLSLRKQELQPAGSHPKDDFTSREPPASNCCTAYMGGTCSLREQPTKPYAPPTHRTAHFLRLFVEGSHQRIARNAPKNTRPKIAIDNVQPPSARPPHEPS